MVELSRRFFLGGAISLIAAKSFEPVATLAASNIPRIFCDGKNGDSFGLAALFRNEPVIFDKDNIGIDEHQGINFHKGWYYIDHTITVPKELNVNIDNERTTFTDFNLEKDAPFFEFPRVITIKKYDKEKHVFSNFQSQNYLEFKKALYISRNNRKIYADGVW